MQKDAPTPVESFVQQANLSKEEFPQPATIPDTPPFVLEAIEEGPVLRTEPTLVVCPGCTTTVTTYKVGLPDSLIHFREYCPECELDLRRWSAVALTAPLETAITPEMLATVTQEYWDDTIWAGATTSGHPRNAEFTEAYTERATAYGWDWTVTCPLCRRPLDVIAADRLDYHHWTRPPRPDQGICLCRQCHDAINAGQCDQDLDWQARELGFGGRHHLQIARLAARELIVETYTALGPLARTLVERYNVPYTAEFVARVIQVAFRDDAVRDTLVDASLHAGVRTDD